MNISKNAIIGILAAVVLIGGVYLIAKDNNIDDANSDVNVNVTDNTSGADTSSTNAGSTGTTGSSSGGTTTRTPDAPTVETGANVSASNSTAAVNGTVRPNGAATTYWYEYGETTALGQRTPSQAIGSGYSAIGAPAFITGLKANTLYYYRLSANNRFSTVNGTTRTFQTNSNPPPVGSAPVARTSSASSISRTVATVNGQVTPNSSSTNYWFEYGKENSFGAVTSIQTLTNTSGTSNVSVALSGLEPLTRYFYRVNAQNQYGTSNGAVMSFTTSGPRSPSSPTATTRDATSITSNSAVMNGRVNPNGLETSYWFEYATDSLLSNIIGNGTPEQKISAGTANVNISANVSGLSANTRYYYRLVARNSEGTVRGNALSFTTRNN